MFMAAARFHSRPRPHHQPAPISQVLCHASFHRRQQTDGPSGYSMPWFRFGSQLHWFTGLAINSPAISPP
ncbi:hypothetical protein E2C01_063914 [Portunus trituberculatus]|uniref:Uncharacterized protein n=1 Tax=Portunus trituberculatus TaxID=210409 RepID=A0A5B7HMD2_PORTR|nr:hypothetical protein [Portunus trituberculatus]